MMDSLWFVIVLVLLAVVSVALVLVLVLRREELREAARPAPSICSPTMGRRVDSGSRPRPTTKSSFPIATGSSRDASRRSITTLYLGGG